MPRTPKRTLWFRGVLVLLVCLGCAGVAEGDDKAPSADAEPATLHVPGLSPKEALERFQVLDGFQMQLVASEPDVQEPIVAIYDENGVLYVAEYLKFPAKGGKSDGPDGRIRLLRDPDGDGRYDQARVFADAIAWPTGICPWKGGVYVVAAPDLWYLKDTDGDDVADVREKVFTGFGFRTDEGTANNLIWGLDNWIHGAGSNSGGEIRPADAPLAAPVSISGRDFRFHPDTRVFEATSGSEQFGNTFDDANNRFICQNSKPAVHVVLPAHYLARNPYLPVPRVTQDTWIDGNRLVRASEIEPWRLARTKLRLAIDRQWDPASVQHDVFTACTGVTIYRGSAYPEKYRGNLFVGDVQGNLIHRRLVQPRGVTFDTVRADADTEMVQSTDNWFRPANLVNAPDGTLHMVDMYREVIETPDSLPDEILSRLDLRGGHDRGRIYRLAPPGFQLPDRPKLGSASTEALVAQLANPNGWWRDTASRLLYERQDPAAVEPIGRLLVPEAPAATWLHALHALAGLSALSDADLFAGLAHASAPVREHAIALAETRLASNGALLSRVVALANDRDARVRFQLAFSLGESRDPSASQALAMLARRDAGDPWMRIAILSSALGHAGPLMADLLAEPRFVSIPQGRDFLQQLSLVVGGQAQEREVRAVLELLESPLLADHPETRRAILLGLGDGLRRSRQSLREVARRIPGTARQLEALIADALAVVAKGPASESALLQAIPMLVHADFATTREALAGLLSSRHPPSVQIAAIQSLSTFREDEAADVLIDAWSNLSPAIRGEVAETLLSRTTWTSRFLDALANQQVLAAHLDAVQRTRLAEHPEPSIRARASDLLGPSQTSPRNEIVANYQPSLGLAGDPQRGGKVFERECLTCHKAAERGHDVGPDLATVRNRTPAELLTAILDPNREVQANYTSYIVTLDDGRILSGLIASESPTSITLKRAENVRETLLRQNIDEIKGTGKSLMPEGLEQKITQQDLADLIAYLLAASP